MEGHYVICRGGWILTQSWFGSDVGTDAATYTQHIHTHTHQKGTKRLITYMIEVSGENRTGFPSETEIKKK